MKLEWLRIDRFRWVQPGTVLHFRPGMNAIIGMNGSGKTTLLNLLAAVWGSDFSPYKDEEIEVSYQFVSKLGSSQVRLRSASLAFGGANTPVETEAMSFERNLRIEMWPANAKDGVWIELRTSNGSSLLEAGSLRNEGDSAGRMPADSALTPSSSVFEGITKALGARLDPFSQGSVWTYIPVLFWAEFHGVRELLQSGGTLFRTDELSPPQLPQSRFRSLALRYWEGSDWAEAALRVVTTSGIWRGEGQGVANQTHANIPAALAPEVLAALPNGELPYLLQISGPDSSRSMAHTGAGAFDGSRSPGATEPTEDAAWLHQLATTLGMRQITLDFRLSAGPVQGNAQPFTYTLSGLFIKKHDGTVLNSFNQLSHGQKRLFGLLWYLGCSPDVLIADELSNGMHWQMVDRVIDAIGERQCFLAMQDPSLLDHMEFESAEDVARAFVSCATAMVDGREQWTWRSFTAEEAEDFYASYKKGWRQVNEILRARGLW